MKGIISSGNGSEVVGSGFGNNPYISESIQKQSLD
jgi:hypothetical protein